MTERYLHQSQLRVTSTYQSIKSILRSKIPKYRFNLPRVFKVLQDRENSQYCTLHEKEKMRMSPGM